MKVTHIYFLALFVIPFFFSCKNEGRDRDIQAPIEVVVETLEKKNLEMKKQDNLKSSVVSRAMMTPELSKFVSAVISAGLVDSLISGEKTYTVFAPSNEAFDAMDSKRKANLYNLANGEALKQMLKGHIVIGDLDSIALVSGIRNNNGTYKIKTMAGSQLSASRDGLDIIFTDSSGERTKLIKSDIKAENGVLHVVDALMGE